MQIWSQGLSGEVPPRGSRRLSDSHQHTRRGSLCRAAGRSSARTCLVLCPHQRGAEASEEPGEDGASLPASTRGAARDCSARPGAERADVPRRQLSGGAWGRVWKTGCWGRAPVRTSRPGLPPSVGHGGSVRVAGTGERSEPLAQLAAVVPAPAALEKWELPRALQAERDL